MSERGVVVWLTGKPSSGKSTLARSIAERLSNDEIAAVVLDGDAVRAALSPPPGYDRESRDQFYTTLANLAALIAKQGRVVVVAATAHRRSFRERARNLAPAFIEVFVDASQAEVEARDSKGLYRAAKEGRVGDVPGADTEYETPLAPEVVARGGRDEEAVVATASRVRALLC